MFASCGADPETASTDTTQTLSDSVAPTTILEPFTPDDNWTNPTERVSQYGPGGIVRDVVIDRDGMIWLAAWDGIVSFDGQKFTNHTLLEGLSHHRVYSVMEDSKGNMWFGTMGAGAYKYDGVKFTNLSSNNGMLDNIVFDLFEDATGNIWFATTKGVSMYNGTSFVNIDSTNGLKQEVYAISQDNYSTMWFGGEAGLFQYNATGSDSIVSEIMTEQGTHYANVRDLCWCNGTMYIGASRGFYVSKPLSHVPLKITRVDEKFTSYIAEDQSGNLLLTSDGIFNFNPTVYEPYESPGVRWTTIVANKSALGMFGAREAIDGTIWYCAMDGLHSVKDGKDVSYKKP